MIRMRTVCSAARLHSRRHYRRGPLPPQQPDRNFRKSSVVERCSGEHHQDRRAAMRFACRNRCPDDQLSQGNTRRSAMKRLLLWIASGRLLIAAIGLAAAMAAQNPGPVFIAGDQPVTEEQVRQKLQSDGWSNVQIARDGRYIVAIASKHGKDSKIAVDSQTGRLR